MNETNEKIEEKFQKQQKKKHNEYHVTNENFDYYNIKKNFHEKKVFVNLTFEIIKNLFSRCRRCRKIFSFNNSFYRYLRNKCSI